MKERIHKSLVTLLFTVVLMLMLANCLHYKLVEPVQPAPQIIEAPFMTYAVWRAYQWFYIQVFEAIQAE